MNKNRLLKEIMKRARITNVESAAFYQAFVEVIGEELARNRELSIRSFGKFSCTKVKSRTTSFFGAEKTVKIPAYWQIRFKAFTDLSTKI